MVLSSANMEENLNKIEQLSLSTVGPRVTRHNTVGVIIPDTSDLSRYWFEYTCDMFENGSFGGYRMMHMALMGLADDVDPCISDWFNCEAFRRFYEVRDVVDEKSGVSRFHLYLSAALSPVDEAFLRKAGAYPAEQNFKNFNQKWEQYKKFNKARNLGVPPRQKPDQT